MECATGFAPPADAPDSTELVPSGWTRVVLTGTPTLSSARLFFTGSCDNDAFVEHLEGEDAIVVRAQDIETPPTPGKPFGRGLLPARRRAAGRRLQPQRLDAQPVRRQRRAQRLPTGLQDQQAARHRSHRRRRPAGGVGGVGGERA